MKAVPTIILSYQKFFAGKNQTKFSTKIMKFHFITAQFFYFKTALKVEPIQWLSYLEKMIKAGVGTIGNRSDPDPTNFF